MAALDCSPRPVGPRDEPLTKVDGIVGAQKDADSTVADWLAHWRVTALAVSDRKESTQAQYTALCRKHLEPAPFGTISLDRLRPSDIEALILAMRGKGLSPSTIRSTYTALRAGLDVAVRDGLLAKNPAAQVKRPPLPRREARHLNAADVSAVVQECQRSRYWPALALIAATGLRRGEACGLRWQDVDLDAGLLYIRQTANRVNGRIVVSEPKTDRSRRTVPLSAPVVSMLRAHRRTQVAERLRAGNQWTDTGLVFVTELGHAVEPRNVLRVIETAAARIGVDDVGVHTLRHSAAVGWLENGVHIKAAADLLGHGSVSITGDIYGHTSDTAARAAMDGLAERLGL